PVATVPSIDAYLEAGEIASDALLQTGTESEASEHVRRVLLDARATAKSLASVKPGKSAKPYPAAPLGTELKLIAQLIRADLDTSVFYAIQNGYDSHSLQDPGQGSRLQVLGDALLAFLDEMREAGRASSVLVLVWSEFGRRVQENASRGTDHGTAGPVFLAGAPVRAGVYGQTPSLTDLDDGNLKMTVDFRRVYASVLRDWMGLDAQTVLDSALEPLPLIRS
ncbi:MAG TPA: DUF1501 domain-containing protein, partial [Planctomycetota bacterium]|nr:DUF1501 domain-containing protein [Planctomycetota bacterium]